MLGEFKRDDNEEEEEEEDNMMMTILDNAVTETQAAYCHKCSCFTAVPCWDHMWAAPGELCPSQ